MKQTVLENLIQNGNIVVAVTEPNGDMITKVALEKLVIGKNDGSAVDP
ncbi:hypothetical protein VBD025_14425 [Virgibacillus flavescens]